MLRVAATLLFGLVLGLSQATSFALSVEQKRLFDSGVYYYDRDLSNCTATVAINLSGNDNIEKGYNFFVGQGLPPHQAAGLIGNFIWESSMIPTSTNSQSGAHGIAQWLGGRLEALNKFAQTNNAPRDDLSLQLRFVWHELNGSEKAAGDDLRSQSTVEGAASSVFTKYERAGDSTGPNRVGLAKEVFELYRGSSTGLSVTLPSSSSSSCSTVGPGMDTQYVDGFTVYSQYDPAWADKPYSTSTIGDSGCGPAAMAMIITTLTGARVTPVVTAEYASSRGLYISGQGSSWAIGPVLAQRWGLKSSLVGADVAKITAALQGGALILVAGKGSVPFTTGGHFIVIRGTTSDGNWLVGDSAHSDANTKKWSPQQILSGIQSNGSGGSIYAIYK